MDDPARTSRRIVIRTGRTRERVKDLLEEGKGVKEIARILALSPSTVSYHRGNLGYPKRVRCARRYDWAAVQSFYDLGYSRRDCQKIFGFSAQSWTDAVNRGAIKARPFGMPFEELLVKRKRGRENIKLRLLAAGIKEKRCERCDVTEWHGSDLSLCLHHINGDRHDNRLENLQLLCPNCHSQTPNFGSKNKRPLAA